MKRKRIAAGGFVLLFTFLLVAAAWATEAEMYFATDKSGENRITKIHEGEQVWIVVVDPDEDIDCDVRDKIWTDVKVMDIKTGAHIVWKSYFTAAGDAAGVPYDQVGYVPYKGHYPGASAGWLGEDYLEETDSGTGVFVSQRPFQFGTRVAYSQDGRDHSHIVGPYTPLPGGGVQPTDFKWGGYLYADANGDLIGDERIWVDRGQVFFDATLLGGVAPAFDTYPWDPAGSDEAYLPPGNPVGVKNRDYMLGRFENMDTVVGLYVDPNDPGDVSLALGKIIDTQATIAWGREVYRDANEAAMVTVVDPDENLNCDAIEYVPVFVLVNPGSWNPQTPTSAVDFCMLKRYGGVIDNFGNTPPNPRPFEWYSIYRNTHEATGVDVFVNLVGSNQPNQGGTYYVHYPTQAAFNTAGNPNQGVVWFDTASNSGVTRVMFYAQETEADSGVFQLNFNSILTDLGFRSLDVRDVLVAYYVDPNDQDDFSLATAYIGEKNHSSLRITDHAREEKSVFWLGRDPVYLEVVDANANTDSCCPEKVLVHVCDPHEVDDAEWLILDEVSSNSSVFFTNVGMRLTSVWDALGIGDPGTRGGYSLQLDNWELEAFNEDSIFARYNDVEYHEIESAPGAADGVAFIGDLNIATAFPPIIRSVRVDNDVSFGLFEVGDTQVYDGEQISMRFLDRQGNPVSGYANSDCVFVEVTDLDQDEDRMRRERIAGFWDGTGGNGQNLPHAPWNFAANHPGCGFADVNVHPVNTLLGDTNIFNTGRWGKMYVLNPRNGRWAPFDLLETAIDSGVFVSLTCIDLVSVDTCVPSLGVLPGDTLIATYQDPSNHSDVAWISIKVGIGGALPTGSTVSFIDASGEAVAAYVEGDPIIVRVVDPSVADAGILTEAVTIDGASYDLSPLPGAESGTFTTGPLDLGLGAGDTVTATYVDPSDSGDTSTATVPIVASVFHVDRFYAGPSPFATETQFGFIGTGLAETFEVLVYDLSRRRVWHAMEQDVLSISWDGRDADGAQLANGPYIYVIVATGTGDTFTAKGTVFMRR